MFLVSVSWLDRGPSSFPPHSVELYPNHPLRFCSHGNSTRKFCFQSSTLPHWKTNGPLDSTLQCLCVYNLSQQLKWKNLKAELHQLSSKFCSTCSLSSNKLSYVPNTHRATWSLFAFAYALKSLVYSMPCPALPCHPLSVSMHPSCLNNSYLLFNIHFKCRLIHPQQETPLFRALLISRAALP